MEDKQESANVTEQQPPPKEQIPRRFVSAARRVFVQNLREIKEGLASLDVREKQVPLEEITEAKIAQMTYADLQRMDLETTPTYDIKDFLKAMGYIAPFSTDYLQAFPDPYRLTRIGILKLCSQGVFEMEIDDKISSYGEGIGYTPNRAKLERYIEENKK